MMEQKHYVAKVYAAPARPTVLGAAIIAGCVAVPVGGLLMILERVWL